MIHYDLGNLYRRKREFSRAVEHYDAALEINPNYIWAWNGLAMSLAALERSARALGGVSPRCGDRSARRSGYFNLAVHLDRSGMGPQAIEAYERFLELSEGSEFAAQRQVAQTRSQDSRARGWGGGRAPVVWTSSGIIVVAPMAMM